MKKFFEFVETTALPGKFPYKNDANVLSLTKDMHNAHEILDFF